MRYVRRRASPSFYVMPLTRRSNASASNAGVCWSGRFAGPPLTSYIHTTSLCSAAALPKSAHIYACVSTTQRRLQITSGFVSVVHLSWPLTSPVQLISRPLKQIFDRRSLRPTSVTSHGATASPSRARFIKRGRPPLQPSPITPFLPPKPLPFTTSVMMQVQTPPRASTSSKTTTPSRQQSQSRVPLGELPLADFVLRASNVSPILRPMSSKSKNKSQSSTPRKAAPATPPHSTTKPVNIRPHHPHVYHSPSTIARLDRGEPSNSPSNRKQTQAPLTPSDNALEEEIGNNNDVTVPSGRSRSDSISSAASDPNAPAPLARKRDRVMPEEVALARQRVDRPIPGSPSPRKQPEARPHSQDAHHHRRNSSTTSLTDFMARRGSRTGTQTVADTDNANGSDEERDDESAIQISPMKIAPSPKSTLARHRRRRSSSNSASRPFFTESLDDLFGAAASSENGGLLVFQDIIEEEVSPSAAPLTTSPQLGKRRRLSTDAEDQSDANGRLDNDKENDQQQVNLKANRTRPAARTGSSSSSSMDSSGSGSMSPFFRSSSSEDPAMVTEEAAAPAKKRGTGGRLSLLASALDSDADSSRGSI